MVKVHDVSHEFRPGLAFRPDIPAYDVKIAFLKTMEEHGQMLTHFAFSSHVGTHVDAPRHILREGGGLEDFALESFYGNACVLDVPAEAAEGIGPDRLEAAGTVQRDDVVLVRTGWWNQVGTDTYRQQHPYLTGEAATWLVERGVKLVGIDTNSVDKPKSLRSDGFAHASLKAFLAARIPVVHNLGDLSPILGKRCRISAFPLVFEGADGGPVRVVAIEE